MSNHTSWSREYTRAVELIEERGYQNVACISPYPDGPLSMNGAMLDACSEFGTLGLLDIVPATTEILGMHPNDWAAERPVDEVIAKLKELASA